jgi:DNA invertase Pin-like site-specific DNA recombinase
MIGAMTQLERDIIRDRVKARLDHARARGIRLGRPPAQAQPDEVHALKQHGLSLPLIAQRVRCRRSTVKRRLRAALVSAGALSRP